MNLYSLISEGIINVLHLISIFLSSQLGGEGRFKSLDPDKSLYIQTDCLATVFGSPGLILTSKLSSGKTPVVISVGQVTSKI